MNNNDDVLEYKIILIGDSCVGKTAILRRYIYNIYEETTISTLGISFAFKEVTLKNKIKIKLKLVDTAGQERFTSLASSYFKNANGVLFVFDFSNLKTFQDIEHWINIFEESNNRKDKVIKYLIGNKYDLEDKKIDQEMIDDFLKTNNYNFKKTSAKDNINIDELFQEMSEKLYDFQSNKEKKQQNITLSTKKIKKERGNDCIC